MKDIRRSLSDLDYRALDHIGRLRFVTSVQLAYWCGCSRRHVDRRIERLERAGLIKAERSSAPYVFCLTSAGSALTRRPRAAGNRQPSWSVIAHACHAAQAEIELHQQTGFRLLDRLALLRQGFNPAHGEHAGVNDSRHAIFVLLDDYGMQSDRITHVWSRRHTPHAKHWPDPTGRAWNEVVNQYLVVTTSAVQAERHSSFISEAGLVATVMMVEPLWH